MDFVDEYKTTVSDYRYYMIAYMICYKFRESQTPCHFDVTQYEPAVLHTLHTLDGVG